MKFDSRKTEVRHDFLGRERGRNLHVVIKLHQVKVQTSTLTLFSRYMVFFFKMINQPKECVIFSGKISLKEYTIYFVSHRALLTESINFSELSVIRDSRENFVSS